MAQNVLRHNVVIVGKFIKGSWVSEAWRKEHPEEMEEHYGPPERVPSAEERRGQLNVDRDPESAVCGLRARHLHTALG